MKSSSSSAELCFCTRGCSGADINDVNDTGCAGAPTSSKDGSPPAPEMGRDGDAPGDALGDIPSDALRLRDDLDGNTNGGKHEWRKLEETRKWREQSVER